MEDIPLAPEALGPLDDGERFDWLRLLRCENIGPRTFQVLLSRHGSAGAALAALPALIASGKAGRPIRIATIAEIEREIEATHRVGARFIGSGEPDYPALLRRTASAPPLIAVRGNILSLRRSKIAIVGARNASAAGLAFTAQLARGIARAGHVIVSGLARGIDARAHQAAIETGTIAVLAGGLGNIYPAEHEALLEQILEHGAAISEMPFAGKRGGATFHAATGLSRAFAGRLSVVEAARRSGSLITAKFAADAGREIFAVPGSPLDPRAEGANDLLRDGATFCTKAEDVTGALAEQNLSREQPDAGFFEPGISGGPYEPLWMNSILRRRWRRLPLCRLGTGRGRGKARGWRRWPGSARGETCQWAGRHRAASDRAARTGCRSRSTNSPAWRKLRRGRYGRLCSL